MEENTSSLIVHVIDSETDLMTVSLGITEERAKELQKLTQIEYIKADRLTQAMSELSKLIKHANELFYCSVLIADIHSQREKEHMMRHILSQMGKGSPD